jgi:GNAT superfamily N-acetyltransferase
MAYANMTGVDRQFTRSTSGPVSRALGYVVLPLYLLTAGRGYKAVIDGQIVGCAFLHMRRLSGFVFNVNVNAEYRRRGLGRALMEHVERQVRNLGRRWVGLHLDEGNLPAQGLYEMLGYRGYHHRFMRSRDVAILQQQPPPGVEAHPLSRLEGFRLWRHYAESERREGDPWAARIIREDYDEGPPPGGAFFSCHSGSEEIGCAWLGGGQAWPVIYLLMPSAYWERRTRTVGLLSILLRAHHARRNGALEAIDLYTGSSAHHDALLPLLQDVGFSSRNQDRILMLKELEI